MKNIFISPLVFCLLCLRNTRVKRRLRAGLGRVFIKDRLCKDLLRRRLRNHFPVGFLLSRCRLGPNPTSNTSDHSGHSRTLVNVHLGKTFCIPRLRVAVAISMRLERAEVHVLSGFPVQRVSARHSNALISGINSPRKF